MKLRQSNILCALACLILPATSAWAASDGGPKVLHQCDIQDCKSESQEFSPPVIIPDGDPNGITLGPLIFGDDGTIIADVVIDLSVDHFQVSDLVATVSYDPDCDGPKPNAGKLASEFLSYQRITASAV